jgi:TonB-dependent starch-binding outer membrane protein SusC
MYKIYKNVAICLIALLSFSQMQAQDTQVSGLVKDETGAGLPGVNVLIKGTATGTTTDAAGKYALSLTDANSTLIFSFIGYTSEEIAVNGRSVIDMSMLPDITSLQEIVVVGYGSQKKADVTGAIASVELKKIEELPLPSVDQIMTGRVAGLQINQSSGQAGAGTSIRIRGGNSINGTNEPLFVVDGFPIINDNGAFAAGGPAGLTNSGSGNSGQGNPGGALNWLNPADIESIDVLKDASATAIYGSRGANGVIIITTKKGKSGQTRMNFSTSYGISEFNDSNIKMMNGSQFAEYDNLKRKELGQKTFYKDTTVNGKLYPSPNKIGTGTNWVKEVTRMAPTKNYSFGFSGGKEVMYSGSLSLFDQQTPLLGSQFKRASARLNIQTNLTNWLTLDNSFSYTTSTTDNSPSDIRDVQKFGIFEAALAANPVETVYNPDGTLNYLGGAPSAGGPGIPYSPIAAGTDILNRSSIRTFLNNMSLKAKVIDGLTLEVRGSLFSNDVLRDIYYNSKTTFNGFQVGGLAGKNSNNSLSYLIENFATYNKTFGANNFNAVLGYSYQLSEYRSIVNGASGFPNDALKNEALSAGSTTYPIQTFRNEDVLSSYFIRLNNVINNKYIFTFTARYDGSSKFGAGNKFALFPSGAFSWRVKEESFLKDFNALSDLKLRVSYGLSGNQSVTSGQSQSFLLTTQYPFGGTVQTGVFPNNLGNPNLKWETTAQLNLGIDFGILDQKVTGSVNYYNKETRDLLQARPIPSNSGFGTILDNIGTLTNNGVEIEIRATVVNSSKFKWDVSANLAHNVQKVTSIGLVGVDTLLNRFDVVGGSPAYTGLIKGQAVGVFYGYVSDGIYTTQEQLNAFPGLSGSKIGSRRFKDINNDGLLNEKDRRVIGNPNPDFTFGIVNNFSYQGFDLSILTQGVVGGSIYNLSDYVLERLGNRTAEAANYYTVNNPNAKYAAPGNQIGYDYHSDFSIQSASYLRVKSVTLGYNFPTGKIKFIRSLRLYTSASNLFTITGYKGFDPEINSFGQSNLYRNVDILSIPLYRTYTFGLNIGF